MSSAAHVHGKPANRSTAKLRPAAVSGGEWKARLLLAGSSKGGLRPPHCAKLYHCDVAKVDVGRAFAWPDLAGLCQTPRVFTPLPEFRRAVARWGVVCAVVVAGCAAERSGPQVLTQHGGAGSSGGAVDAGSDAAKDDSVTDDAATDDAGSESTAADAKKSTGPKCPGAIRCPCAKHADCDSGACAEADGKMLCIDPCKATIKPDESCDGVDNDCDGQTDEDTCDDGNPCTQDSCGAGKCANKAAPGLCDDGDSCTVGDKCKSGKCVPGAGKSCDDGNPCTTDGCKSGPCEHVNNSKSCNDGDACTTKDICAGGKCAGKTKLSCNDGNACTTDSCDKKSACKHVNTTKACNDGNACTVKDTCKSGKCVGLTTLKKPACKVCIATNKAPPLCTACLLKFTGTKCDKCKDASFTGPACDKPVDVPNSSYCKGVASWQSKWRTLEAEIVKLVNIERAKGNTCGSTWYPKAAPLKMEGRLRCAARVHSKDMVVSGFFSHNNKQGQTPFVRIKLAGYKYWSAAENIAAGNSTPAKTMVQWMKSPGHCKNIMSKKYTQIGVGYYPGGKWGHMWTQTFGKPK